MARCANCGFLAIIRVSDREQVGAGLAYRDRLANPPDRASGNRYSMYEDSPLCAEGVIDFSVVGQASLIHEFQKDRDCDNYRQWVPGLSPKDHRARVDRDLRIKFEAEQLKQDREWRETQRQEDLNWRAKADKDADARHADQMTELRRQGRVQLWVLGFLVAAAITFSTLVGAMISAGWIGDPFHSSPSVVEQTTPQPTP